MIEKTNTKDILAESFTQLIRKKPVSKIRIINIVENCSMSRETFYYHFNDKYDLMLWIYNKQLGNMISKSISNKSIVEIQMIILSVMLQHKHFYEAAFFDQEFSEKILKLYVANITQCVIAKKGKNALLDRDIDFSIHFYANGLLQMEKKWLKNASNEDLNIVAKQICDIMPDNIKDCYIF